jgi:hypothetical protein
VKEVGHVHAAIAFIYPAFILLAEKRLDWADLPGRTGEKGHWNSRNQRVGVFSVS